MQRQKNCQLCPRLVDYRHANRTEHPDWFNGAVPSFGQENAEVLIVGLAPGVTGANRTGRPFTGDWAGDLLYATLAKFNLSKGQYDRRPDDGLRLKKSDDYKRCSLCTTTKQTDTCRDKNMPSFSYRQTKYPATFKGHSSIG